MSGIFTYHTNLPLTINGTAVGRCTAKIFDDGYIEIDVTEVLEPFKSVLGPTGPFSVSPEGGDAL